MHVLWQDVKYARRLFARWVPCSEAGGAFVLGRTLRAFLYGMEPADASASPSRGRCSWAPRSSRARFPRAGRHASIPSWRCA